MGISSVFNVVMLAETVETHGLEGPATLLPQAGGEVRGKQWKILPLMGQYLLL
jgi:hypothetical protein